MKKNPSRAPLSKAKQALAELGAHWHPEAKRYYLPVYTLDEKGQRVTEFMPTAEWRAYQDKFIGSRSVFDGPVAMLRYVYRYRGPRARVNPWPRVRDFLVGLGVV